MSFARALAFTAILLLSPAVLLGQFGVTRTLKAAKKEFDEGNYEVALQQYLTAQAQYPESHSARNGARIAHDHYVKYVADTLLAKSKPFDTHENFVSWRSKVPTRYFERMVNRGLLAQVPEDAAGPTSSAMVNDALRRLAHIDSLFALDAWVAATGAMANRNPRLAYQNARQAMTYLPSLRSDVRFDSLWLSLGAQPIKVAVIPFADETGRANGLQRQLYTAVSTELADFPNPLLEVSPGEYLGLLSSSAEATPGSMAYLKAARERGFDYAVVARVTRALDGVHKVSTSPQTAYLSRTENGRTVADIPTTYYQIEASRELAYDLSCELIDLESAQVVDRETYVFSHTDVLQFADYPGGNVNDLSPFSTHSADSKLSQALNLVSSIGNLTSSGKFQRQFEASRSFIPLDGLQDKARNDLKTNILSFIDRAALPRE